MNGLLEYKSIFGSINDVDEKNRVVTGYLAHFGNEDSHGDIIEKGAFAKTINDRKEDIFFLNQHNWAQPHGKFSVLKEDSTGLYFESNPLIDTTFSNDLIKLYAAKIVKEHSIGYQTIKAIQGEKWMRTLKEVKLYEGSNVTLGSNPKTPFLGFKCATIGELNDQVSVIVKAMRNGSFTDETFMQLEVALKQLQLESYELGKTALEEPKQITQENEPLLLDTLKSFTNSLNF